MGRELQLLIVPQARLAGCLLPTSAGGRDWKNPSIYLGRPDDRHPSLSKLRMRYSLGFPWRGFRQDGRECAPSGRLSPGECRNQVPRQCGQLREKAPSACKRRAYVREPTDTRVDAITPPASGQGEYPHELVTGLRLRTGRKTWIVRARASHPPSCPAIGHARCRRFTRYLG